MKAAAAAAALAVILASVPSSRQCQKEGKVLICHSLPPYFDAGCLTVLMFLSNVGEINSTQFRSDNLTSVAKLAIDNAGVSAIAEGAFSLLRNLTALSLRGNVLTQVSPGWFGAPASLADLALTDNRLEAVTESTLSGLVNLKQLRLNRNRIGSVHPDSLRSNGLLAELDLSENRLTRVSPRVFLALNSTRIRLDGNPWDCSCGAEDFVAFLRDLSSRSLLERQMDVTCGSPPSLSGRPVSNVSVCVTALPPGSPSAAHLKPTAASTAAPTSTANCETFSSTRGASNPEPEDPPATSPPSTENVSCASQPLIGVTTVCVLAAVIGLLCLLLSVLCVLAVTRRSETVAPSLPEDERKTDEESGWSGGPSPGAAEDSGPSAAERTRGGALGGVRAKSANAVVLTSPFRASGKVRATVGAGVESEDGEKAGGGGGGGAEERLTHTPDMMVQRENPREHTPQSVGVHGEAVPYLSIGTRRGRAAPDQHAGSVPGHGGQGAKVIGRISTWPPTAVQWQARREATEEAECDGATLWPAVASEKFSSKGERKVELLQLGHETPSADTIAEEERTAATPPFTETPQNRRPNRDAPTGAPPSAGAPPSTGVLLHSGPTEEENQGRFHDHSRRPSSGTKTTGGAQNLDREPPSPEYHKGPRRDRKPAGTGGQKAERRAAASMGPSGGSSPDDETLLSGNEYAAMDLLHEVVQNNGRWTRERWKQIHANKQRVEKIQK